MERPRDAIWRVIKVGLTNPHAESDFWEKYVKDRLVPGGAYGVRSLIGTVVSIDREAHPPPIRVAMNQSSSAEVVLRIGRGAPQSAIGKDQVVEFSGIAVSYNREPFAITFEIGDHDTFVELEKPSSK